MLSRVTRSVAPTAAGERLAIAIGDRFDEIEAELDTLTELRDKAAGSRHRAMSVPGFNLPRGRQ